MMRIKRNELIRIFVMYLFIIFFLREPLYAGESIPDKCQVDITVQKGDSIGGYREDRAQLTITRPNFPLLNVEIGIDQKKTLMLEPGKHKIWVNAHFKGSVYRYIAESEFVLPDVTEVILPLKQAEEHFFSVILTDEEGNPRPNMKLGIDCSDWGNAQIEKPKDGQYITDPKGWIGFRISGRIPKEVTIKVTQAINDPGQRLTIESTNWDTGKSVSFRIKDVKINGEIAISIKKDGQVFSYEDGIKAFGGMIDSYNEINFQRYDEIKKRIILDIAYITDGKVQICEKPDGEYYFTQLSFASKKGRIDLVPEILKPFSIAEGKVTEPAGKFIFLPEDQTQKCNLQINVTDGTSPVSNCRIILSNPAIQLNGKTSEYGKALLTAASGNYTLIVKNRLFNPHSEAITIDEKDLSLTKEVEVKLNKISCITGLVTIDGKPQKDIDVRVINFSSESSGGRTTTSEEGRYFIPIKRLGKNIVYAQQGNFNYLKLVNITEKFDQTVDFDLQPLFKANIKLETVGININDQKVELYLFPESIPFPATIAQLDKEYTFQPVFIEGTYDIFISVGSKQDMLIYPMEKREIRKDTSTFDMTLDSNSKSIPIKEFSEDIKKSLE